MPKSIHFLKTDKSTSQNLASAALSYSADWGKKVKVEGVYFKASVGITETITITLDSALGANYDIVLRKRTLSSEQNFVFIPEGELNLQSGDKLLIACTNANVTGVVYVNIKASEMGV